MNILIVDDEKRQRAGIAAAVRAIRPDARVAALEGGTALLKYLECGGADLIISDISMPDLDGLQLLERIRASGLQVPVVFLSGYALFSYAQRALQMGAFDYLLKPVDPDEVLGVIEKIERMQAERERDAEWRQERLPAAPDKEDPVARRFQQYLMENYMRDLSLDSVAMEFGLNPNYFCGLVKSLTGETFSRHLANVRIEKAKVLLRDMDLNIYDISEMVGYRTPSYFAKVFKAQTGMNPEHFRRVSRQAAR